MIVAAKQTFFIGSAAFIFLGGSLEAFTSKWTGPGSNLAMNTNWSLGIPTGAGDEALFTGNAAPNPSLSTTLTLGNLTFDNTNPGYTFTLNFPANLTILGDIDNTFNFATQAINLNSSILNLTGNSPDSVNVYANLSSTSTVNVTGPQGSSVFLNMNLDTPSTVTVQQNQIKGNLVGFGSVQLVQPSANLTIAGGNDFQGIISGQGSVTIGPGITYTYFGPNTYSGPTTVNDNSILQFNGNGQLNPNGALTLLPGPNGIFVAFNGNGFPGTFYPIGDLTGDVNSEILFGSNILAAGGTGNTTYGGTISSPPGTFIKKGTGSLTFTNNNLVSELDVNQGTLTLSGSSVLNASTVFVETQGILSNNGQINSPVTVQTGGTLTGAGVVNGSVTALSSGIISGNLTINGSVSTQSSGLLSGIGTINGPVSVMNGGRVSPGLPPIPGTLTINGTYLQVTGTEYLVNIQGKESSLIELPTNLATLHGGEVIVQPTQIVFDQSYTILSANGGVSGRFDGASSRTNLVNPVLVYEPTSVLLFIEPDFTNGAHTYNQTQVALQLDTLLTTNSFENSVLSALFALDPAGVGEAYDELSGNQYTSDPLAFSMINRQFIRRLFDPLRPLVTALPCERCETSCFDLWFEGGWERGFLRNDGNGFGFNLNGWDLTAGIQKSFSDWTIGFAGSYAHDYLHYNLGGHGTLNSGFAGIYGLYRPDYFYILADLSFGFSDNVVNRSVKFIDLSAKATPQLRGITFYTEAGIDFPYHCFLLQPFVGLEILSSRRGFIAENGLSDFDLIIDKREDTLALGRLGFHLTSSPFYQNFSLSLDAAWDYQLSRTHNDFQAHFAGFGDEFTIKGATLGHHSFEGAVTLINDINDCLQGYLELSGQIWERASSFNLVLGAQSRF